MKVKERNRKLLEQIQAFKAQHPFWGCRRIWAYLKYRQGRTVNRKRSYRLMKENHLLFIGNDRLKALRVRYPLPLKAPSI